MISAVFTLDFLNPKKQTVQLISNADKNKLVYFEHVFRYVITQTICVKSYRLALPLPKALIHFCLGNGNSNPHWFHIAIFPVTAANSLKIRQYSLRDLLCYRKNCLCETASTCSAEFLQRISVRKGAGGLTPVKTDKAQGFVKIQSTGNAGSSPHCLNASAFAPQQTSNILSIFSDVL